jgi:signal transduction histidine kinase
LQERLEAVETRAGIETSIQVELTERLPSNIEQGLYSIAREAMNNILKHANATKTTIRLSKHAGKVVFEIYDNGIGLDKLSGELKAGLGIKGMEERAAQMGANLTLETAPQGGTILKVEVPDDRNN